MTPENKGFGRKKAKRPNKINYSPESGMDGIPPWGIAGIFIS